MGTTQPRWYYCRLQKIMVSSEALHRQLQKRFRAGSPECVINRLSSDNAARASGWNPNLPSAKNFAEKWWNHWPIDLLNYSLDQHSSQKLAWNVGMCNIRICSKLIIQGSTSLIVIVVSHSNLLPTGDSGIDQWLQHWAWLRSLESWFKPTHDDSDYECQLLTSKNLAQ